MVKADKDKKCIVLSVNNDKKKNSNLFLFRMMTLVVLLCIALYSGYNLFLIEKEYKTGIDEYENLHRYVSESVDKSEEIRSIDFNALKALNKDIVGWIYFENGDIDYPIVKGTDNSYYLHYTFKNEENKAGSIFMDYQNDVGFKDEHTIIYGHNMKNGTMFGMLRKYAEEEFYDLNSVFWIYSEDYKYKCEIFSCYITKSIGESFTINFTNKNEYGELVKKLADKSLYNTGITVTEDDFIVTLSTCWDVNEDSRLVVHAKMIKQ